MSRKIHQSPAGYYYLPGDRTKPHTAEQLTALGYDPAQAEPTRRDPILFGFQDIALIVLVALVLGVLFALPADAQAAPPLTPTQRHAAEVAKGEAPPAWVGLSGYTATLCTMQSRLADPRFPDTLDAVLAAYYAPARELTEQEAGIAADIFDGRTVCHGDAGEVYFYALSHQDVIRHDLPAGDWQSAPFALPSGTEMGIHLYVKSPWSR